MPRPLRLPRQWLLDQAFVLYLTSQPLDPTTVCLQGATAHAACQDGAWDLCPLTCMERVTGSNTWAVLLELWGGAEGGRGRRREEDSQGTPVLPECTET